MKLRSQEEDNKLLMMDMKSLGSMWIHLSIDYMQCPKLQ